MDEKTVGVNFISRRNSAVMAEDELYGMVDHLLQIGVISSTGNLSEWKAGIEQVRAALQRLANDIEATRIARVQ
jgi:hypothetical protein